MLQAILAPHWSCGVNSCAAPTDASLGELLGPDSIFNDGQGRGFFFFFPLLMPVSHDLGCAMKSQEWGWYQALILPGQLADFLVKQPKARGTEKINPFLGLTYPSLEL